MLGLLWCCGSATGGEVDFRQDILPLLADRCFACHGPDAGSRQADLRLDTESGALAELAGGGYAVVPRKPDESELLRRVRSTDDSLRMPPVESHLSISAAEADLLERWIADGAEYTPHWSFVPLPAQVTPPEVTDAAWPASPIDRFVLAKIEAAGLSPAPRAAKLTWLRRVTCDLTGLPPTSSEIDDFLGDSSAEAYEKVVDRLLASPHFGEHMAVPWLDAARYADSYGYQSDLLSTTWPYRDWVVRALNDNLPYDEFLTWQLAGDLLPGATRDQKLATAFNRLHRMTNEGGSISEEFRAEYAADRAQTLGTAILGLTIECARCHDHKFDPLSQREFYQLTAFFDNIDEWGTYNDMQRIPTPSLLLPTPEQETRWQQLRRAVAEANDALAQARHAGEDRFRTWLADTTPPAELTPGLVGYYPLDEKGVDQKLANLANTNAAGATSPRNEVVAGKLGQALRLVGDEAVNFPGVGGALDPNQAYSVAMWIRVPDDAPQGIIFHRSGGTDTGYHGAEARLRDGRLFFAMIRFWPGNALAVESISDFPTGRWVHVAFVYDGSVSATGMHLYIDGERVDRIVRDNLTKHPGNGGSGPTFGERFRDLSLPGMKLDELRVYHRGLTPIEVAQLHDEQSLADAFEQRDADSLRDYYFATVDEEVQNAARARNQSAVDLLAFQTGLLETMVMDELPASRETHLLARGEYDAPRNEQTRVEPGVPAILGSMPEGGTSRLDLSRWLTSRDHPLTARVAVNRYWQLFFGRGLVETAEDFGTQGAAPTHPELLDWLARDFIDNGWNVKRLCRTIVLSSTYGQASASPSRADDPANMLLARGPSGRLSAEVLRDWSLAASGLLDRRRGGPPVSPYQPGDLWTESNSMSPAYRQSVGGDLYRRSLYTVVKRTAPAPNMLAFDATSREVCTVRRSTTNTPIQALVLLNDPQFVEAARVLAEELLRASLPSDNDRVDFAFLRLAGRRSSADEQKLLVELLEAQRLHFAQNPSLAASLISIGNQKPDQSLPAAELAAATIVVQTIQNLDASVWKR